MTYSPRYTKVERLKLSLRAPNIGANSWEFGDYDEELLAVIEEAESRIDSLCDLWSPFDQAVATIDKVYTAGGEAIYGWLDTEPYTVVPSTIEVNNTVVDWDHSSLIKVTPRSSGRSLVGKFEEGTKYTLKGGSWGWNNVPAGVSLAATRIAARTFMSMKNKLGVIELADGAAMYEPKYDTTILKWLGPTCLGYRYDGYR